MDYQMALRIETAQFDGNKPLIKVQLETNQLLDTHFNMPKVFQYMVY